MVQTLATTFLTLLSILLLPLQSFAQCSIPTLSASYAAPSVAPGYSIRLVANGLRRPRGIKFDSSGHLLVLESGKGLTALTLNDSGGSCIGVRENSSVIADSSLNHAIEVAKDGKTLYASTSDKASSWPYDAANAKTTGDSTTLVQGMDNDDHTTRTLLLSRKVDNKLVISRGSNENIDSIAADIDSGHSQIRVFDIGGNNDVYTFSSQGTRLGWGLRNSVGVAEHPVSGGIYSVENSADDVSRLGKDIHENNPGEEMNFHGYLNGTKASPDTVGANFGYPECYAAWNTSELPRAENLQTGGQFGLGGQPNDEYCSNSTVPPVLTFPAHWAPLDMVFNSKGSVAYVTSHGSWNRDSPDGYLLFAVPFQTSGTPVAAPNSTNSWLPIMSNADNSKCPNGCFRPVGLAWDSQGRLFMTSDSTGEIYVITTSDGKGIDSMDTQVSGNSSSTSANAPKKAAAGRIHLSAWALLVTLGAALMMT